MKKVSENKGITLIALVITIIVLLILAGVSINAVIGQDGILSNAQKSTLSTTYATYLEELQLNSFMPGETPTYVGEDMKTYIAKMSNEDLEKFIILKGELYYIGNNVEEATVANQVGIKTDLSGGSATDVITITDKIVLIENEAEYVGTQLLDKNITNNTTWKLAIDYSGENTEIARYGTGYYLIEPNVEYTVDGEKITLTDYYVVNYETDSLIGTNNIKVWDYNSTVAVTEGLVLNIDPTNMANIDYTQKTGKKDEFENEEYDLQLNGVSTGIKRYGDVSYNATTRALMFNESADNATGEGGYMSLKKSGVDFSNGFSFEMYANLSRLNYNNGNGRKDANSGLFCRMPTLSSNFAHAMRFGFTHDGVLSKYYQSSTWYENYQENFGTSADGRIFTDTRGYDIGEDFYLTFVYTVYDNTKDNEYKVKHYDDYMIENNVDKVEYYVNGELFGHTYYGSDSYQKGCAIWNTDECPFFLGVCPWFSNGNLYYLKGSVYTCRLYTCSMSAEEVSANYNATLQYRSSF